MIYSQMMILAAKFSFRITCAITADNSFEIIQNELQNFFRNAC